MIRKRLVFVFGCLALAPCWILACVDFSSVKAAASVAQKLGDEASVFGKLKQDCIDIKTLRKDDPQKCDPIAETASELTATAKALTDYGGKLLAISTAQDSDPSTQVGALASAGSSAGWYTALTAQQAAAVKSLATDIVTVLSSTYRQGEVAEAIKKTNDSIQLTSAVLAGSTKLATDALNQEVVAATTLADGEADPWKHLMLNHLVSDMKTQEAQLKLLQSNVAAFAAAHAKLLAADGHFDKKTFSEVLKVFGDVPPLVAAPAASASAKPATP